MENKEQEKKDKPKSIVLEVQSLKHTISTIVKPIEIKPKEVKPNGQVNP